MVEAFARHLQVQERLTSQIADIILTKVKPLRGRRCHGSAPSLYGNAGDQSKNAPTVTSAMLGVYFGRTPEPAKNFWDSLTPLNDRKSSH